MKHESSEPPGEAAEEKDWRRNAVVLAAGNLVNNLGWNASFAFLPLAVKAMDVGRNLELWVGVMLFGYYMAAFAFTPVWGVLADHYGRKSMVLRAAFGMAAGFALLAFIYQPLLFLVVLTITGVANGYNAAAYALVATTTPRAHVGSALATAQIGAWIGAMMGPMSGAMLIGILPNVHALFFFTAVVIAAAGLMALVAARERHVRPSHALRLELRADIARLWTVPDLKVLYYLNYVYAFVVFGALGVVTMHTMQMLDAQPGFGGLRVETWVAITVMGFTVTSVLVMPVWGRALNRNRPERVLTVLLAGGFVTSLLLPLARDPLELALARILSALFMAGLLPVLVRMINDRAPPGMAGRTLSYGTAVQQVGSAVAPLIAGLVAPYLGLRGYFWFSSLSIVIGLVVWLRGRPPATPARAG